MVDKETAIVITFLMPYGGMKVGVFPCAPAIGTRIVNKMDEHETYIVKAITHETRLYPSDEDMDRNLYNEINDPELSHQLLISLSKESDPLGEYLLPPW